MPGRSYQIFTILMLTTMWKKCSFNTIVTGFFSVGEGKEDILSLLFQHVRKQCTPPLPPIQTKRKKTRHHTVKNNWLCKHNLGSSRFAEKYLGVMMNHIHESTMASFSGKKKQLPHQDYEQQCPLQDMWITLPTIIHPRKASFGGLLSIWGNLSNMQIYSGLWVLRTGEQMIRHLWRWDGRPKELELFSWKKKIEERHGSSLLIGERGKE